MKYLIEQKIASVIAQAARRFGSTPAVRKLFLLISDFILREGKRIRPILFLKAYQTQGKQTQKGIYDCAAALELLHAFVLIHDDIIDKSDIRRGKPSMHAMLKNFSKNEPGKLFRSEDLALITGDMIYAAAIKLFLSSGVGHPNKERSLEKILGSAVYTGLGEFQELIYSTQDIKHITADDIYRVYDLKTAHYTFAAPMSAGAAAAGASENTCDKFYKAGIFYGRAYQIKDDLINLTGDMHSTGKPSLVDLEQSKKTILLWHAYHNAPQDQRHIIEKPVYNKKDIRAICGLMKNSGSFEYAKSEILKHIKKAEQIIKGINCEAAHIESIMRFARNILQP